MLYQLTADFIKSSTVKRKERLKSVETYNVILGVHKQDATEWYKYWYTASDLNNSKSMSSYTGTTHEHTHSNIHTDKQKNLLAWETANYIAYCHCTINQNQLSNKIPDIHSQAK